MKGGKGLVRSLVRRGTADGRLQPEEARRGRRAEPVVCERCGAMLHRRRWQRVTTVKPTHELLARARWETCPACEQQEAQEYQGRVLIAGEVLRGGQGPIRRRIHNVAERAEFTQVEHRVVSIEESDGALEVLTTSQKLAHRIVHELKKTFGGRATYRWLDDGCLEARWRAG
jgi:NMD protein affecting ribosome stability and mRNA decay